MEHTPVARAITRVVRAAIQDTPVIFIGGPRQSGKSTLAQSLVRPEAYRTLDDAGTLAAALSDRDGFIANLPNRVVIDEVQRAPDLLLSIKASVDRDRRPGRFILTGSADILALPRVSESLAGRIQLITLWPFSASEIEHGPGGLVDELFTRGELSITGEAEGRKSFARRVTAGGFPEALARHATRRSDWFDSYVTTITLRDVPQLMAIQGATQLPLVLRLLGARASSILNVAELARSSEIAESTLRRYLSLLEIAYVLRMTPAWSGNLSKRLLRHPKISLADSGLAAHLQGVDSERLAQDEHLAGPLFEDYVRGELVKQSSWSEARPAIYHFRTTSGDEVDIVMERRGGEVVGVEVKASASVTAGDFRGLRVLAEALGKKFRRGIVLNAGRQVTGFGPNLLAVPFSALWEL